MHWPLSHCAQKHLSELRPATQQLLERLRFCLVPLPGKEYRFTDVRVEQVSYPSRRAEFLVYLLEDRTIADALRALPAAVAATQVDPLLAQEIERFLICLARTLKYNAAAFVIEPPVRPDLQATMPGVLPRTPAEQAIMDGLPALPAHLTQPAQAEPTPPPPAPPPSNARNRQTGRTSAA